MTWYGRRGPNHLGPGTSAIAPFERRWLSGRRLSWTAATLPFAPLATDRSCSLLQMHMPLQNFKDDCCSYFSTWPIAKFFELGLNLVNQGHCYQRRVIKGVNFHSLRVGRAVIRTWYCWAWQIIAGLGGEANRPTPPPCVLKNWSLFCDCAEVERRGRYCTHW